MVKSYRCDTWQQFAEVVDRVERRGETAIVGRPTPPPPMNHFSSVWLAFIDGQFVGSGNSEAVAQAMMLPAGLTPTNNLGYLQAVMESAVQEARQAGVNMVGTEHLLLGALRQEQDQATQLLASRGITREAIYREYRATFPDLHSHQPAPQKDSSFMRLTPKAAQAIRIAMTASSGKVRISHLLLALLQVQGISSGLLEGTVGSQGLDQGQSVAELEQEIRNLIRPEEEQGT